MAVGGMASLTAALGVAACGAPGSTAISGPLSSASTHPSGNLIQTSSRGSALRSNAQNKGVSRRPATRSTGTGSVPTPAWLVSSAQAAQAWIAATNAFANASFTDYWRSPALSATEVSPELSAAQSLLRSRSDAGIVARGSLKILSVQVTSVTGSYAQVVGCVGGNLIDVYLATGRPVSGIAGHVAEPKAFSADLVQTASGWKVERQSVREGSCSAG